ncbi:MAG: hypothetical protein QF486_06640 [Candidatus Woesearchaeota archaeon]|jgi:hypothetical protein|nr:hypothetical protein [Candidatus Woesearchaeota archaeon]MDP7181949.1 hypothetical protein [Candidatus Woesearchaeota archaeon]MDP7199264.1 hypothetical protein [Candidatus Woesearchaeota archaeon]MDP7467929.1 hypothetical protein [Candidatus Woesearchaeota archaeon]MDP7647867.1 hypothetical protein [Candidatus Woesearchaeota archaeon]
MDKPNLALILVVIVALLALAQVISVQKTGQGISHVILSSSYASYNERNARLQERQELYQQQLADRGAKIYRGSVIRNPDAGRVTRYHYVSPQASADTLSNQARYRDDFDRRDLVLQQWRESARQSEAAQDRLKDKSVTLRNQYRGQQDWSSSLYRRT